MSSVIQAFTPSSLAERYVLESIVDGTFPPGGLLPPERELSERIGVTRTTLREVIAKLARDGWVTIRHGKPTRVNQYKSTLSLSALDTLITLCPEEAEQMVSDLFYIRFKISPRFFARAIERDAVSVSVLIDGVRSSLLTALDAQCRVQNAEFWGQFVSSMEMMGFYLRHETDEQLRHLFISWLDYHLYHSMAKFSGNSLWPLMFNSVKDFYFRVSRHYYEDPLAMAGMRSFLDDLSYISASSAESLKGVMGLFAQRTANIWKSNQEKFYGQCLNYERG